MASAPSIKIERAHQMYREGRYSEALGFYTEALIMAKTNPQKIALHSNRAACFLKLHDFKKAAEECTSVLELDHQHTGALMLRAQTLVTLKEYQSALFDVNRLIEMNPLSEVYQDLYSRLKTQLSLAPIPESEEEFDEEEEDEAEPNGYKKEEPCRGKQVTNSACAGMIQNSELHTTKVVSCIKTSKSPNNKALCGQEADQRVKFERTSTPEVVSQARQIKEMPEKDSKGWQAIPKPKGHSTLDYARWDRVEEDSSGDDDSDEDEESQPQFRFRVRTIGVRPVK